MTLRSKIYWFYKLRMLPRLSDVRGAQFVERNLARLATIELEEPQGKPKELFSEEWDNLIIIDACRHDLYETVFGETKSRITLGSHSQEFLRKNFADRDLEDIIYITGNPFLSQDTFANFSSKAPEEVFHSVYYTHETDWDEDKGMRPEPICRDARSAEKLFPEKKKIIHFMQPHFPVINSDKNYNWDEIVKGEISEEEALQGYRQNLEFVMGCVEELIEDLDGKTIITSDHGNFVGENGMYDHPARLNKKVLKKVPWDVRE